MPHSYAPQFRQMVVERVRSGRAVAEVAASVEVAESTVYRWVRQDGIDRGEVAGTSSIGHAELRAARRRIAELEAELATVRRATELFSEGRVVLTQKRSSRSSRPWPVKDTEPSACVAC